MKCELKAAEVDDQVASLLKSVGHLNLDWANLYGPTEHHAVFAAEFALPGAIVEAPRAIHRCSEDHLPQPCLSR